MFKIINLKADNYKVLDAFEINPNGQPVEIHGKNGRGKSTVLDCIQEALAGKVAKNPIRNGEESGKIVLEIGENKTQYIITRTFTDKGSYLKVENADGFKTSSPQKMLDELIGRISFDPLSFSNMDPKKQRETILGICPALDVSDLDLERKEKFDERTGVNRVVKELQVQVDELRKVELPEDLPVEIVNAADIMKARDKDLADIEDNVSKRDTILENHRKGAERIDQLSAFNRDNAQMIIDFEKQIAEIKERIALNNTEIEKIDISEPQIGELEKDIVTLKDRADDKSLQLEGLERTNEKIRARDRLKEKAAELESRILEAAKLTGNLEQIDKKKKERFAAADLPVPGLVLGEDGIFVEETPFEDLATSERLRVSFNIAMALNPRIKVVFIRDGSLLDPDSLAEVYKMAEDKGFQVWIEVTTADEKIGFMIKECSK